MKQFFAVIRRRLLRGIRLSGDEQATIEAVVKRMRKAIRKHKGIRLNKDELRVLGLYGLKRQAEQEAEQEAEQRGESDRQ